MALLDVINKLNIDVDENADDAALEAAILNHSSSLLSQLEEAKKKPVEPPKKKEGEEKTKLPTGILNMITSSRDLEITNLVSEGRITPAVADELRKKFANKDTITNCIDDEGEPVDGFDAVIEALKKNEVVVNYSGKGHKVVAGGKPEGQQESVLVANAKARGSSS